MALSSEFLHSRAPFVLLFHHAYFYKDIIFLPVFLARGNTCSESYKANRSRSTWLMHGAADFSVFSYFLGWQFLKILKNIIITLKHLSGHVLSTSHSVMLGFVLVLLKVLQNKSCGFQLFLLSPYISKVVFSLRMSNPSDFHSNSLLLPLFFKMNACMQSLPSPMQTFLQHWSCWSLTIFLALRYRLLGNCFPRIFSNIFPIYVVFYWTLQIACLALTVLDNFAIN